MNEHPCPKLPMQQTTRDTTRTMDNKASTSPNLRDSDVEAKQSIKQDSLPDGSMAEKKQSFGGSLHGNRQQTPKALLYYPEECHMPSIAECK